MKFTFLIPVYIARPSKDGWKVGDAIYDHPTPLDGEGTLNRTLESLNVLRHEDFDVVLLTAAVAKDVERKAAEWVRKIIKKADYVPPNTHLFSHEHLDEFKAGLSKPDAEKFAQFFDFYGYSNMRNVGFMAAIMQGSDAVIWLDDDELVLDADFLKKLREGFYKKISGKNIRLITGACPEGESDSAIRVRPLEPWTAFWNKIKYQNLAFERIIYTEPRWKVTPFAHGGLSAVHKDVFAKVPFDPEVSRGEDMDYNINARMYGYKFFLDNKLAIRHLPPPRIHPKWRAIREDMLRFIWQRNKIRKQRKVKGMVKITAAEFDPYPGEFMKDNLEEMIFKSQITLAMQYLAQGKTDDAKETLNNIQLSFTALESKRNAFDEYTNTKNLWEKFTPLVAKSKAWVTERLT